MDGARSASASREEGTSPSSWQFLALAVAALPFVFSGAGAGSVSLLMSSTWATFLWRLLVGGSGRAAGEAGRFRSRKGGILLGQVAAGRPGLLHVSSSVSACVSVERAVLMGGGEVEGDGKLKWERGASSRGLQGRGCKATTRWRLAASRLTCCMVT